MISPEVFAPHSSVSFTVDLDAVTLVRRIELLPLGVTLVLEAFGHAIAPPGQASSSLRLLQIPHTFGSREPAEVIRRASPEQILDPL
jgi:hypothetical protein